MGATLDSEDFSTLPRPNKVVHMSRFHILCQEQGGMLFPDLF